MASRKHSAEPVEAGAKKRARTTLSGDEHSDEAKRSADEDDEDDKACVEVLTSYEQEAEAKAKYQAERLALAAAKTTKRHETKAPAAAAPAPPVVDDLDALVGAAGDFGPDGKPVSFVCFCNHCTKPAKSITIQKRESLDCGKTAYVCAGGRDNGCNYYEVEDAATTRPWRATSCVSGKHRAYKATSKSAKNPGRDYFAANCCGFFEWADEPPRAPKATATATTGT